MRPINFRAWDNNTNTMYQVDSMDIDKWVANCLFNHQKIPRVCTRIWWPEDNFCLMQFTWLLDKNWKEIYEGDIVKWCNDLLQVSPYWTWFWLRWKMFRRWGFCTCDIAWQYMIKSEVIWNIHENPDLLN